MMFPSWSVGTLRKSARVRGGQHPPLPRAAADKEVGQGGGRATQDRQPWCGALSAFPSAFCAARLARPI